jgi:hypothetical protein
MTSARILLLVVLVAIGSAGCTDPGDRIASNRIISIDEGRVEIRSADASTAVVTDDGQLRLDGKPITVNASQQALLRQYHAAVLQLRADGAAVGSAGVKVAGKAIGGAISGLLGGDPDQIEAGVEAEARRIEASVAILCDQLDEVHTTGKRVAAMLPQFEPYASVELGDCREHRDG